MPDPVVLGQQPAPPASAGVTVTTVPPAQATAPAAPFAAQLPRKRNAKLSHEDMKNVISAGGSVLHNGEIFSSHDQLPDAADLAKGDAEQEAAAREAIDAQIAALTFQRSRLSSDADKPQPKTLDTKPKG